jgi:SAM-dependent methyltransferase
MNYYDDNAKEFFDGTVDADMSSHHKEFLNMLGDNACILDAGCGSGRDTKLFKSLGHNVIAIDASAEMCRLAGEYTGVNVRHLRFQDINFIDIFDGIWASASLLHVPTNELDSVLVKLKDSLKDNGVIYASFKYGDFEGMRNGRFFNDFTETTAKEIFERNDFKVIKTWQTQDSRPERDETWVNILARNSLKNYHFQI